MDSPRNIGEMVISGNYRDAEDHDDHDDQMEVPLPGFRFHPTDEELVGFYLRRKVHNKPITLDLIKLIDIYKYDPWDLPKASSAAGDKEWYFFCKRGRKYKNSIRPNRVTGSGFWKATGIDKPVHSHGGDYGKNNQCIGLKKTLVYYRGSAGKGTKTDWMMHEFRLPTTNDNHISPTTNVIHPRNTPNSKADPQEAEIWTLCRIFKRNMSYRRYTPDWRELSTKRQPMDTISSKKSNSMESNHNIIIHRDANYNYIDFSAPATNYCDKETEKKPVLDRMITNESQLHVGQLSSMASHNLTDIVPHSMDAISSFSPYPDENGQFFTQTSWDELGAVVELALDPALM